MTKRNAPLEPYELARRTTRTIGIRVPLATYDRIAAAATAQGCTLHAYLAGVIYPALGIEEPPPYRKIRTVVPRGGRRGPRIPPAPETEPRALDAFNDDDEQKGERVA